MALPTIIGPEGPVPTDPSVLRQEILDDVTSTNPGYTANLPGSLVEDILSTDIAAVAECDQARVETINSLTPLGANDFLLLELGQQTGVVQGAPSRTSVFVEAFDSTPGFAIAQGFTVSDGNFQYALVDGGIVASDGTTGPLFAVATTDGIWSVPAGTVNQVVTSVPNTITLNVTNQTEGTPGTGQESSESFRAGVLQAERAIGQGTPTQVKTLLRNVPGVQPRLISLQAMSGGGYKVLCGGGDPYQVADAIFKGALDPTTIKGSVLNVVSVTKASDGVVTTDINHNYLDGQNCAINGALGMTQINGLPLTAAVLSPTTFSTGVNTSGFGVYTSGGVVTPDLSNITVSVFDYPDTYEITYVNPPSQSVAIAVTWNTTATNFVSDGAIEQATKPALAAYVNAIVTANPMNLFSLEQTMRIAVASILPPELLTRMVFAVSIDGIGVSPDMGTGIIAGDKESYFLTDETQITVTRG